MVKILHLADLHLGWKPDFLGPKGPGWQEKRDNLLSAVVDFIFESGVDIDLVLIVGDLFDRHTPPPKLVTLVTQQIQRLIDHNIYVITVPGNHDEITYPDSVYRQQSNWPGILITNPKPDRSITVLVNSEPCHIYSLAYTGGLTPTSPPLDKFLHNGEKGWHIAAFHGSLDWDAGDRSLPLSGEALADAGYDYVALGHIHKPSQYPLNRGIAVYPGSLAGKGFNDPGCGELTVATLSDSGVKVDKLQLEKHLCPTCRTITIDTGLYYSLEELAAGVLAQPNTDEPTLLRLTGVPNFLIETGEIEGLLDNQFYYLEVLDATDSYLADNLQRWAQERTVRGLFIKRMQERLLNTKDERERRLVTRAMINGLAALGSEK